MGFSYHNYYTTPMMSYVNYSLILAIATIAAAIIGVIIYFVFLKKSNEGRFRGFKKTVYNLLAFNRFYAENIIKFVYVILACIVTIVGIVMIVLGSFMSGIFMIIIMNIIMRVVFELVLMFIMLCKKTVSMDRRLSKIEDFYMENYGDDWGCGDDEMWESPEDWDEEWDEDEDWDGEPCDGNCGSCSDESCASCGSFDDLKNFKIKVDASEDGDCGSDCEEEKPIKF